MRDGLMFWAVEVLIWVFGIWMISVGIVKELISSMSWSGMVSIGMIMSIGFRIIGSRSCFSI